MKELTLGRLTFEGRLSYYNKLTESRNNCETRNNCEVQRNDENVKIMKSNLNIVNEKFDRPFHDLTKICT